MNKPASTPVNIQDPFFYQLRRDARPVHVYLVSGKRLGGVLRRFDRYSIVLDSQGQELLVYKHAIASVALAPATAPHDAFHDAPRDEAPV